MREKPKRFSISLPPDLTERLKKAQEAYDPRLSRRALLETLIRKGLEETEDAAHYPETGGTDGPETSYNEP